MQLNDCKNTFVSLMSFYLEKYWCVYLCVMLNLSHTIEIRMTAWIKALPPPKAAMTVKPPYRLILLYLLLFPSTPSRFNHSPTY